MTNKIYKDLIDAVRSHKLYDFLLNNGYRLSHTEIVRLFLSYMWFNEKYISDVRMDELYADVEDGLERFKGEEVD